MKLYAILGECRQPINLPDFQRNAIVQTLDTASSHDFPLKNSSSSRVNVTHKTNRISLPKVLNSFFLCRCLFDCGILFKNRSPYIRIQFHLWKSNNSNWIVAKWTAKLFGKSCRKRAGKSISVSYFRIEVRQLYWMLTVLVNFDESGLRNIDASIRNNNLIHSSNLNWI